MLPLVVLGGAWPGMATVETIGRIRRAFWVDKKPIRQIVRELRISRQTVRKAIRGESTEFRYERQVQPQPRLGAYVAQLDAMLEANSKRPARERLTARRLSLANAFVARWCLGYRVETIECSFRLRDDEPAPRVPAPHHRTP